MKNLSRKETEDWIEYRVFNIYEFMAALILIGTLLYSLTQRSSGLLFVIYALPTWIWSGVIPGIFGIVILIRLILRYEKVRLHCSSDVLTIETQSVFRRRREIPFDDIVLLHIGNYETQPLRSIAMSILLFFNVEVHYLNGIDLFGDSIAATMLLVSGILTTIGLVLILVGRNNGLEVYAEETKTSILIPRSKLVRDKILNEILGRFNASVPSKSPSDRRNQLLLNVKKSMFKFTASLIMITSTFVYTFSSWFYFGQFTPYIGFGLGIYYIYRVLDGKYEAIDEIGLFKASGLQDSYLMVLKTGFKTEKGEFRSRWNVFEVLLWFYLASQSIKYGFRFIWVPTGDVVIYQIILSAIFIILISLIFLKKKDFLRLKIADRLIAFELQPEEDREFNISLKQGKNLIISLVFLSVILAIPAICFALGEFIIFS